MACAVMMAGPAAWAEEMAIRFPPGWTVSVLPAPTVDGQTPPGRRRRAILSGATGRPLAAIELVELPQTADRRPQLSLMMEQARQTATADYRRAGLDDVCAPATKIEVAAQDGLRTSCVVRRGDAPVLHQVIVMWASPVGLYSLSYSAPPGSPGTGEEAFAAVLGSVHGE